MYQKAVKLRDFLPKSDILGEISFGSNNKRVKLTLKKTDRGNF
jgi:hypothetical protein